MLLRLRQYALYVIALCLSAGVPLLFPSTSGPTTFVIIPLMVILLIGLVQAVRHARRQDALLNLRCPSCGFDIREQFSMSGNTCPECGHHLGFARWRR